MKVEFSKVNYVRDIVPQDLNTYESFCNVEEWIRAEYTTFLYYPLGFFSSHTSLNRQLQPIEIMCYLQCSKSRIPILSSFWIISSATG